MGVINGSTIVSVIGVSGLSLLGVRSDCSNRSDWYKCNRPKHIQGSKER